MIKYMLYMHSKQSIDCYINLQMYVANNRMDTVFVFIVILMLIYQTGFPIKNDARFLKKFKSIFSFILASFLQF